MTAFLIVAAVMLLLFLKDIRSLLREKEARATVFYCVVTIASFIVIALQCLYVNLRL